MIQLKSTKYWLPPNTYYVSCVHTFIKIISFTCLFHCLGYLSPTWITFTRIILSNDVETNHGDFVNNFIFCNWDLNSLAKNNFYRVKLLEVHNSFHNYDFISICETSLDDTVELPDVMLENDNFVSCNNPSYTRRGGVGLFYKNNFETLYKNMKKITQLQYFSQVTLMVILNCGGATKIRLVRVQQLNNLLL